MIRKYRYTKEQLLEVFYSDGEGKIYRISTGEIATRLHKPSQTQRVFINGHYLKNSYVVHTIENGDFDNDLEVDHEDLDTLNDHPSNLRSAKKLDNMIHRRSKNKHGKKGVAEFVTKKGIFFKARIKGRDGKRFQIGVYNTVDEAHEAYKKASIELHGEFSNTQTVR